MGRWHFVGIAKEHPHQALIARFESDDMLAINQNYPANRDLTIRTYDFSPLWRSTVGFDRLFDLAETAAGRRGSLPAI